MTTEKHIVPNAILLEEARRLLAEGKEVILMTKGQSMMPFIVGDRDSVAMVRKDEVSVGDIVLAKVEGGRYVLHRVFGMDGDNLTLMGDGNLRGQEHCTRGDVAGTVVRILRPGRKDRIPTDGHVWRRLMPLRRYILGVERRLPHIHGLKNK